MILSNGNLKHDEEVVLKDSFYSFKRLILSHSVWAPFAGQVVAATVYAEAIFLLTFGAFTCREEYACRLCGVLAIALFAWRAATIAVLIRSTVAGNLQKRMYRRTMIYWSWWPLFNFIIAALSAIAAISFGHYLWYSTLEAYHEIAGLQPYKDINPSIVPGAQLQDAGLVDFSLGVNIDRSKGGCFVQTDHTYCVAPILYSGELFSGLGNAPTFGSYDYFAVGIDCCTCPNQDFRCGSWKNPLAQGGIRSVDYKSRPSYRLAVDNWAASYMKESRNPLFFEWVQDPEFHWNFWRVEANHTAILSCVAPIPILFLLAVISAHILRVLIESSKASPFDVPRPPDGFDTWWATFFPDMLAQFEEDRNNLMKLPIQPRPAYAIPTKLNLNPQGYGAVA